jgi:hypothetical protein
VSGSSAIPDPSAPGFASLRHLWTLAHDRSWEGFCSCHSCFSVASVSIASTDAQVASQVLTRGEPGKPPPATTGCGMPPVFYTRSVLGAPVGRADVGCAGRAMCLDQGPVSRWLCPRGRLYRGGSAEALPPKCVWVDEELRTRPLTGQALRLQRLAYRQRQPELGSSRSELPNRQRQPELGSSRLELRDPQRFLPRPRCLLWVRSGQLDAGIVMDRLMEPLGERLPATQSPPPEAG